MAERLARIQLLIDTTVNWQAANPILLSGEIGLEIKTNREIAFKVGNGTTAWNSLGYVTFTPSEVEAIRDELHSQIDNIVIAASTGADPEVAQSRVDASGKTYETLKARLDAVDATLTTDINNISNAVVDITGNQFYQLISGSYINISLTSQTQTLTPVSSSSGYGYIILDCVAGDTFTITGEGGGSSSGGAILWTFINVSNQIISHAATAATASDLELTAPPNAVKLIVNSKADVSIICKGRLLKNKLGEIDESHTNADGTTFESLNARLNATDAHIESEFDGVDEKILDITGNQFYSLTAGAYINISTSTSTVNLTPQTSTTGFGYAIIDCLENDIFVVTGEGGGNSAGGAILWAWLDSSNKWIDHANTGEVANNLELVAPTGAVKFIVNSKAAVSKVTKNKLVIDRFSDIANEMSSIKSISANSNTYTFAHGGLNSSGTKSTRTDCIISPFIKVVKGSEITIDNEYVFQVAEYSSASEASFVSYRGPSGLKYIVKSDGYIRVTCRKAVSPATINNIPYMATHLHLNLTTEKTDKMLASGFSQSLYDRRNIADLSNKITGYYNVITQTATDFGKDTTFDEFMTAFNALVAQAPNYITKETLGQSSDDKDICCYTLHKPSATNAYAKAKPKVIIIGCQHGFEKGPSFGIYYFVRDLISKWADSPILEYIKHNVDLKIIPIVNSYGYDNQIYKNANGVNINRNYDCAWELVSDTTSSEYGGAEPFDQPESQIVRDLVLANKDACLFVDYHNLGRTALQSSSRMIDVNLPEIADDYAQRLYTASIYAHTTISNRINKDHTHFSDDLSYAFGTCNKAVGTGLSKSWASAQNVIGVTLELTPGWSAGSEFSESNKRATAEYLVNYIMEILNHLG